MLPTVEQTTVRGIDPLLGYGYLTREDLRLREGEDLVDGCVRLGAGGPASTRIGILGGSTTDISLDGSWVRPFREVCIAGGHDVTLYSGGVSGYSSSQELLKLIRDVLPCRPKIVLSLNGINDLGFVQAASAAHPMIHSYQGALTRTLLPKAGGGNFFQSSGSGLPAFNRKFGIGGMTCGARNTLSAAQVWGRNIRLMRAACAEFEIPYLCFLQPVIGVGNYSVSQNEAESFAAHCTALASKGSDYAALLREFYTEARAISDEHRDFVVDLVDAFAGMRDVYSDIRHPNSVGNARLAQIIFDRCKGLLS